MTFFALAPAEARLPLHALFRGLLPLSPDFSERFGEHLGVEVCGLANSARTLLYLLFKALRSRAAFEGGEILVPGYTCYSVAAAVVKAGCKVALYDLDPSTLQPDLEDVKQKINSRTLAVVGQHLLGVSTDISSLSEIAHDHGLCCIEDAAQYLGCSSAGSSTVWNSGADFSVFSFGRGKPLPLGGGGALIASSESEFAEIPRDFESLAWEFASGLLPFAVQILSHPRLYWLMEMLPLGLGRTVYNPAFGVSAMPPFYQRSGAAALASLESLTQHRTVIGHIYHSFFSEKVDWSRVASMPAYVRYPLLVQNQEEAGQMAMYGVRQLYPLALCDLPALKENLAECRTQTRGAREIAQRLVTLPTHLAVDENIAHKIARKVHTCFRGIETIQISRKEGENNVRNTLF